MVWRVAVVGLALGAATCNGDDGNATNDDGNADTAGDGVDAGPGDDSGPNLTSDFDPICDPGAVRCAGADIETCAGTGLEWVVASCGTNSVCEPCGDLDPGCSEARCVGECQEDSDVPDSAGCEFIANRQLHPYPETPDAVVVANPNKESTATVRFYQILEGTNEEVLVETATLDPGEDFTLLLDNDFVAGTSSLLRSGGMFRVRSDFPVIAYQHSPYKNHTANDSSMLLPDEVLGTTYVVTTYNPHAAQHEGLGRPTYFEVVTLTKGTSVTWTPPVPTFGTGAPIEEALAGATVTHSQLNRYDTLRVAASKEYDEEYPGVMQDLSGTVIRSSDPIWVVGASRCSRVPTRELPMGGFCDPLQEVLIPVEHWGSEYLAAHPPLRDDETHHWRVYAGDDGIKFTTDPQVLTDENCAAPATFEDGFCTLPTLGSWIEIEVPHGQSFLVKGETAPDDAFMVVGYLQSRQHPGEPDETSTSIGDPAMYQLVPTQQFLKRYVFRTAEGYDPPENEDGEPLPIGTPAGNYVQIVRTFDSGSTVFLDGSSVNTWEQVGDFALATVRVKTGSHTVESAGDIGISVIGFSNAGVVDMENCLDETGKCASSYAYPGGMKSVELHIP